MEKEIYQDLIGRSFQRGAKGPDYFDCWGVAQEIARRRGFIIPDEDSPEGIQLKIAVISGLNTFYTEFIPQPEEGAVVVFKPGSTLTEWHLGTLLSDKRTFIHAGGLSVNILKKSVRIEQLSNFPWHFRIFGYLKLCKKMLQ